MCRDYMSHFTKESWVYDLTFGNSVVVETVMMIFPHSVLWDFVRIVKSFIFY